MLKLFLLLIILDGNGREAEVCVCTLSYTI